MPLVGPELPPEYSNRTISIEEKSPTALPHKPRVDSSSRKVRPCPSVPKEYVSEPQDKSNGITTENLKKSISQDHKVVKDENISDSANPSSILPARRIIGPAPPPLVSQNESDSITAESGVLLSEDGSSDSDDDYGPSLPPSQSLLSKSNSFTSDMGKKRLCRSQMENLSSSTSNLKRAEWMLIPPTSSDWTSRIDTTKLKNRKFTSGRGVKRPADGSGPSAIWTETPEEKRQRLEDEVLGRKDVASLSSLKAASHSSEPALSIEEERQIVATREQIYEFNKRNRNKSLFEERKAAQDRGELKGFEEDDPSLRAFDKEKDIGLGTKNVSAVSRKQLLIHAKNFGNRFQEGKYL